MLADATVVIIILLHLNVSEQNVAHINLTSVICQLHLNNAETGNTLKN